MRDGDSVGQLYNLIEVFFLTILRSKLSKFKNQNIAHLPDCCKRYIIYIYGHVSNNPAHSRSSQRDVGKTRFN